MSFGGQTVTFVVVTLDENTRDRYNNPATIRNEYPVPYCRFRPLTAAERIELGDKVTDPWKCTAPPVPDVVNAVAVDEVIVDDVTYQIIGGVRVFPDMAGVPFKVTIICERRVS